MTKHRGQLRMVIEGRFHLRLKKLNDRLRPSNIQTQPVLEFMHQLQFEFPDAPPALTNIIAGYKLNSTESAIDGVYIVCPNGDSNAWDINVDAEVLKQILSAEPSKAVSLPTQQSSHTRTSRTVVPLDRSAGGKAGESRDEESK